MKQICAWADCREVCDVHATLRSGWVFLATFRATAVPGHLDFLRDAVLRDAVLCDGHALALEALLKPI